MEDDGEMSPYAQCVLVVYCVIILGWIWLRGFDIYP